MQVDRREMEPDGSGLRPAQRGSGLGELLLLTAASTLVIAATASHVFPTLSARPTARGSAQQLHTYLQLARVEAVARNRPIRVAVVPAAHVMRVLDPGSTAGADAGRPLYERPWPAGIEIAVEGGRPATDTSVTVDFRPDGAEPLAVTLADAGGERAQVWVDPAARIGIEWLGGT